MSIHELLVIILAIITTTNMVIYVRCSKDDCQDVHRIPGTANYRPKCAPKGTKSPDKATTIDREEDMILQAISAPDDHQALPNSSEIAKAMNEDHGTDHELVTTTNVTTTTPKGGLLKKLKRAKEKRAGQVTTMKDLVADVKGLLKDSR
ncbi:unnamed protein product, partial [Medioppia subpectinata]